MRALNTDKILYWNKLRTQLNKWILVFIAITLIISFTSPEAKLFTNISFPFKFPHILVAAFINLFIYIAFINFIVLVLELLDRTFSFKERKKTKNPILNLLL